MNNKFNIKSVLLSSAATLLLASGLATQANAGQINMDFTQDSATFITESTNNESGSSDYKTSGPTDTSATFKVRLSDFNDADDNYGSNTLSITGTRSAVVGTVAIHSNIHRTCVWSATMAAVLPCVRIRIVIARIMKLVAMKVPPITPWMARV